MTSKRRDRKIRRRVRLRLRKEGAGPWHRLRSGRTGRQRAGRGKQVGRD